MFKIHTLNTISPKGLNQLPKDLYDCSSEISNPDAILLRSHVLHDTVIPDSVKAIGRAGAGVNNIPVADMTKRGIPVFNTPGANANAVRELVIAGMLLASRNICQAWYYVNQITDKDLEKEIEKNKKQFIGFELMGKTLGIIGLGSIGVKVANAAVSLGMHVVGYDPTITVDRAWELSANVMQAKNLDDLLTRSDLVSFHVPLTNTTKNMINVARIKIMKSGVILLNFARDGIIEREALVAALNEKKIHSYVTDFPLPQLTNHPCVINLPHLGASTKEAEENCAVMIVNQIRNFLETGSIVNAINFPILEVPHTNGFRLAIVNENVPNMVAQVSTKLGGEGLNILSLLNKSLDNIAYMLIDTDQEVNKKILEEISAIDGIVQVRRIT